MFESLDSQSVVNLEEKTKEFWQDKQIFQKSLENRKDATFFSFFDGPPFATGLPHYGHILASTIKDTIGRYKTMQGYYVPRRFGWDCHGLPVENEIEKSLDLKGSHSIKEFGVDNFNEECRKIVLRYQKEWQQVIGRLGRWVDFGNDYLTMDASYMESVWWVFKELHKKSLIYKGFKVMPFSTKLGTPLSNFEANLNYKNVDDPSIVVKFSLKEDSNTSLLVWTTTPWTLVSNLAATVNKEYDYVKVKDVKSSEVFILALNRLQTYFKVKEDYEVIETLKGADLVGLEYNPLFDYFKDQDAFKVIADDFVTLDNGTGIVHTAPGFGENDFYACQKAGIEPVCPVDQNGAFTADVSDYKGILVHEVSKDIIKRLKENKTLFHQATINHRYPFCWRTDTPLIYRLTTSWFVSVEKIKDKIVDCNQQIYWMPDHLKNGRFGKWLDGARDWAVSRNRYWGTPLPIWEAEDGEIVVIGSVEELKEYTGETATDLHSHFIDKLIFKDKSGKVYKRVEGVFDCWFESGSMPFAQNHYPFENKELFEKSFPADFIAEGIDQTRGWFYTLTVLAAALFDTPAFKNVVVNGIILAENGQKMSKRLKNYPDPMKVVDKFGADALRLYLLSTPVVKGEDMRFCEKGVEHIFRQAVLPLLNSYHFFSTYANIYNFDPNKNFRKPKDLLDRWVYSRFYHLLAEIEKSMDQYNLNGAVEPLVQFIDQLTNWYIRRSRRRFWNNEATHDRDEAFSTLYIILKELTKVLAPFLPFISETIYQKLSDNENVSVHLEDYPVYQMRLRDMSLEKKMKALQSAVSLGHSLRKENKLKVRQPLSRLHLAVACDIEKEFLKDQAHLMQDELNVKEVVFHDDESELVSFKLIPNFRVLGKKVGKLMRQVQVKINALDAGSIQSLIENKPITIDIEGESIELNSEDIEVTREVKANRVAANIDNITLALDTELNKELIQEGISRELINKIQMMRKEEKLSKTDRIHLKIQASDLIKDSFEKFKDHISSEVLATAILFDDVENGTSWDINGEVTTIEIQKDMSFS